MSRVRHPLKAAHAGATRRFLLDLLVCFGYVMALPVMAAPTLSPSPVASAPPPVQADIRPENLPPGSCAELADMVGRLACLKTRIARQETGLMPDLLTFLAASPQTAEPPLPWLQALSQPALIKRLVPLLQGQPNPVIRQHLLLLFQYLLLSHAELVDMPTRTAMLSQVKTYLGYPHLPTQLQALDFWLMQQKAVDTLPQLNQLLAGPNLPARALGLVHYARWLTDANLKKRLPPLSPDVFLSWTQQPDVSLAELRTWTFHAIFRSGSAGSFLSFLGAWLDSSPPDTVKFSENALLLLLRHAEPSLRAYALKRLALTGNPAYASRIEALFDDADPTVRLKAQAALTQLQKLVPLQYLASLKDPNHLPPDAPERIRSLMRNPDTRDKLLDPAVYGHLARQPAYLDELWNLLQTSTDPALLGKGLQMLRAAPSNWPLSKLEPLLEPSQDVKVRAAALGAALQRPFSPELGEMLRPLLRDPQVELPVEILEYLFRIGAPNDARNLMSLLAARQKERIERRLLPFDGVPSSDSLEAYVAQRMTDWILKADPQVRGLGDWLSWTRDANLPVSWRRLIVQLVGNKGRSSDLLPLLRQLNQDANLSFDAGFALDAVEGRIRH